MTDPLGYVIVCSCGGQLRAIAYLDDDRPGGGELHLDKAPAATGQIFIGSRQLDGSTARDQIAKGWAETEFSENVNDHGVMSWTIRCAGGCRDQAQLSERTLPYIADVLRAKLDAEPGSMPPVPVDDHKPRHIVSLYDVVRYLSRNVR